MVLTSRARRRPRSSSRMPSRGKCANCGSLDLDFFEDGEGECLECGRTFRWDRKPKARRSRFDEERDDRRRRSRFDEERDDRRRRSRFDEEGDDRRRRSRFDEEGDDRRRRSR